MLRTCFNTECQKLFSTSGLDNLCPKCVKKEDEYLDTIRSFLEKNPSATSAEIHAGTEIPSIFIDNLLKSGRLNMVALPNCNRCGEPIKDPVNVLAMCQKCSTEMKQQINSEILKTPQPNNTPFNRPSPQDFEKSYGLGRNR